MKKQLILSLALLLSIPYTATAKNLLADAPETEVATLDVESDAQKLNEEMALLDDVTPDNLHGVRMSFDVSRRDYYDEKEWSAMIEAATDCISTFKNDPDASVIIGLQTARKIYDLAKQHDWIDGQLSLVFPDNDETLPAIDENTMPETFEADSINRMEIIFEIERDEANYDADTWQQIVDLSVGCGKRFAQTTDSTFDDACTAMEKIYSIAEGNEWARGTTQVMFYGEKDETAATRTPDNGSDSEVEVEGEDTPLLDD